MIALFQLTSLVLWGHSVATLHELVVEQTKLPSALGPQLIAAGAPTGLSARALSHSHFYVQDLENVHDIVYTINLDIGSPGRRAKLILDTGSSDLWVSPLAYAASSSRTSNLCRRRSSMLVYGTGQVFGDELCDRVCLADLCVANQSFVAVQRVEHLGPGNVLRDVDGILGLAFPALLMEAGAGKIATFLQSLGKAGAFAHLSFSLVLKAPDQQSMLRLGELQEVKAAAAAATGHAGIELPVLNPANSHDPLYWMVAGAVAGNPAPFAVDSGTTLIVAPLDALPMVFSRIMTPMEFQQCKPSQDQPFTTCPCNVQLKPLDFQFIGQNDNVMHIVKLTPEELLGQSYEYEGTQWCYLNIQFAPTRQMQFWILGTVFMKKVHTVFDVTQQKVYLYPNADTYEMPVGPAGWFAAPVDSYSDGGVRRSWNLGTMLLCLISAGLLLWHIRVPVQSAFKRKVQQTQSPCSLLEIDGYYQTLA
mmetsp:Transcript_51129/g.119782  ORF Transcript_51129/g.119782 Transcript_51129/m.119782 type:complete len:476 (+) Transcript_51129:65-1492(+)